MLSKKRGSKLWGPLPFFCELTRSATCSRRVIVIRGVRGASISTCQGEELSVSVKGNQAPTESFLLRKTGFKQCWRKIILATVCKMDCGIERAFGIRTAIWRLMLLQDPGGGCLCSLNPLSHLPVEMQPLIQGQFPSNHCRCPSDHPHGSHPCVCSSVEHNIYCLVHLYCRYSRTCVLENSLHKSRGHLFDHFAEVRAEVVWW